MIVLYNYSHPVKNHLTINNINHTKEQAAYKYDYQKISCVLIKKPTLFGYLICIF